MRQEQMNQGWSVPVLACQSDMATRNRLTCVVFYLPWNNSINMRVCLPASAYSEQRQVESRCPCTDAGMLQALLHPCHQPSLAGRKQSPKSVLSQGKWESGPTMREAASCLPATLQCLANT